MLKLIDISGNDNHTKIKHFSVEEKDNGWLTILSSHGNFLDELQKILTMRESLFSGKILLDNKDIFQKFNAADVQVFSNTINLFENQTVAANIFIDKSYLEICLGKNRRLLKQYFRMTGLHLSPEINVENLSNEQKKMVEMLRIYYLKPRLLIVRDLSNQVSHEIFSRFLDVVRELKERGTFILFLTDQWEEAVKYPTDIVVVVSGKNKGTFKENDIKEKPEILYKTILEIDGLSNNAYEEETEFVKSIARNIKNDVKSSNMKVIIKLFNQYLFRELRSENVVTYLLNRKTGTLRTAFPESHESGNECYLRQSSLEKAIVANTMFIDTNLDKTFSELFEEQTNVVKTVIYPMEIDEDNFLVLQINYSTDFVFTRNNQLLLKWIAEEMAIALKKAQLQKNSFWMKENNHRIKNSLQLVVSLLEGQKDILADTITDSSVNDQVNDAFQSAITRVQSIANIQSLLSKDNISETVIDMQKIVRVICNFYENDASIFLDFDEIFVPYKKTVSIALVFNELINNSIKHNKDMSQIKIRIKASLKDQREVELIYRDNGSGSEDVDGDDVSDSHGMGMTIIKSIVCYELEGKLQFPSESGGFHIVMNIPVETLLPFSEHEFSGDNG